MNNAEKKRELEARKQRGIEAEKLLSNPLIDSALRNMETSIINKLKALDSSDVDNRDVLWRDLQAVTKFAEKFKYYLRNGREAQTLLDRLIRSAK